MKKLMEIMAEELSSAFEKAGYNQPDAQSGLLLALSHRTQFRRLRALPH